MNDIILNICRKKSLPDFVGTIPIDISVYIYGYIYINK